MCKQKQEDWWKASVLSLVEYKIRGVWSKKKHNSIFVHYLSLFSFVVFILFYFLYCQRFSFNRVWNIFVELSSVAVVWLIFHVELVFMMGQSFHLLNTKFKVLHHQDKHSLDVHFPRNAKCWNLSQLSLLCTFWKYCTQLRPPA